MGISQKADTKPHAWRSSKLFTYIVVNVAVFTDAYLYGLIIPVLPFALTEVVGVPKGNVQWWIGALLAAYGVGLLVGAPVAGYYADRTGSRRAPYMLGLIALAISTTAISLGRTTWILFIGRLVQGASSASVHAVGMAILADTVGDEGIGPAMGFVTMNIALGQVFGPMVGGLLYHNFGYFAVFLSAYALVAGDFALRILMVERIATLEDLNITHLPQEYGTFADDQSSEDSFIEETWEQQPEMRSLLSPSPTSTSSSNSEVSAAPSEQAQFRHPILELLSTPRMLAALLGDFMQSLILTGLETILPLRIKTIFHYNSQKVAFVFLVLSIPYAAGPAIGHVGDRFGSKKIVSLGFAILMPLTILLRLVDHYEAEQVALLCILLLAIGTALNMILTPVWSDTMYLVDEKSKMQPGIFGDKSAYAQAFGLMNMAYAIGSVIGPLMGGWLMKSVGWNWVTLGAGILSGCCAVPCLVYTGGKLSKNAPPLVG